MNANATYHIFLSYNSLDRPIVLRVAEELEKRGCSCFLDQWYLQPGHDWVAALEQALASSRSAAMFIGQEDMGRWQQRERAWVLDRNAEDPSFAVVPVLLPGCKPPLGFLKQLMWIDLRQDPTAAGQLDALAATGRGKDVDREGLKEPRATICPYRGLLYFREEDAAFFFGRDKYIDELVQKVEQRTLVAVVGASGSGKSSVVRAGLVPRLRSRDNSPVWEIVTMLPGENPLHALADVVLPLIEPELSGYELVRKRNLVAEDLAAGKTPLWDLVAEAQRKQKGTDRLLLMVDQWEELYTQCKDRGVRQRFIEELLEATSRNQSPLSVVLTVRSDFYGELLQDRPLLDRLHDSKLDLGPMDRDELRAAIEEPAKIMELTFQDGLVDRLLDDARDEPGRLPLLEFALEELWKRRERDGHLTHAAYADLGRLSGAVATRAELVYGELKEEEQAAAPALFRRLVRAGAKSEEDTRRRADLHSLDDVEQRVARHLTDERLLVTTRGEATSEDATDRGEAKEGELGDKTPLADPSPAATVAETVEVAHEELLRRWDRLKRWIEKDRQFLQWRSRLAPLLEQYKRDPQSALLRHGALREARQFFPSRSAELEVAERRFVDASLRADRQKKIKRWTVGAAVLLLACGIVIGVRAYLSAQKNRETVAAAVRNLPGTPAIDVPGVLDSLRLSPEYASELLRTRLEGETADHVRLRLALGLVATGTIRTADDPVVDLILDSVPSARASESANLVQALSQVSDRPTVLDKLRDAAREPVRLRYDVAAMCLGAVDETKQVLALSSEPENRTSFIHGFSAFPGDLERVAAILEQNDEGDFRSGLCAALGKVSLNTRSPKERQAIVQVMQQLYQEAKDGGTHSAAGWALRQWQVELPPLTASETFEEIEERTRTYDWYVNSAGMTLLKIAGGTFEMGARKDEQGAEDDEKPRHEVTVSEFWLGKTEVTQSQWTKMMGTEPWKGDVSARAGSEYPAVDVSWDDAMDFCRKLTKQERAAGRLASNWEYRLPTEAEWEYACRAKSQTMFYYGDDDLVNPKLLSEYGVFDVGRAAECGSKLANGWGLFDMHGNVWEWCADWYADYEAEAATDPQGPQDASLRVLRGGSWWGSARLCRSASRDWLTPSFRSSLLGFRLALVPSGKSSQEKASR